MKEEEITLYFRTDAKFNKHGSWSHGLVWVKSDNTALYLDEFGKITIDVKAIHEKNLMDEFGLKQYSKSYPKGIDLEYLSMNDFSEQLGLSSYDGEHSIYLDKDGNIIFNKFNFATSFNEGVAFLTTPEHVTNFIMDKKGNITTSRDKGLFGFYWNALHDGLFVFESFNEHGKMGYKNANMDTIIEAKYDSAAPFNQGLAFVQIDSK